MVKKAIEVPVELCNFDYLSSLSNGEDVKMKEEKNKIKFVN